MFLQAAEEEASHLSAPVEEEDEDELVDESMDEGEGGLPSLGKRRSTDTALFAQTASKRPRPGSLAEVRPPGYLGLTQALLRLLLGATQAFHRFWQLQRICLGHALLTCASLVSAWLSEPQPTGASHMDLGVTRLHPRLLYNYEVTVYTHAHSQQPQ